MTKPKATRVPPPPKHAGMDELDAYQGVMGRPPGEPVPVGYRLTVGRFTLTAHSGRLPRGAIKKLRTITRPK